MDSGTAGDSFSNAGALGAIAVDVYVRTIHNFLTLEKGYKVVHWKTLPQVQLRLKLDS